MEIPVPKSRSIIAKVREFFHKGETTLTYGDVSVSLLCSQFGIWPANGSVVAETVPIVISWKGFKAYLPSFPVQIELPFETTDPITQELFGFKVVVPFAACHPQFVKEGQDVRIVWSRGGRPQVYYRGIGFDIGSILLTEDYGILDFAGLPPMCDPRLVWKD